MQSAELQNLNLSTVWICKLRIYMKCITNIMVSGKHYQYVLDCTHSYTIQKPLPITDVLWSWFFYLWSQINRSHPWFMGKLSGKFNDHRCKTSSNIVRKPFSIIRVLWPWPLNPKSKGVILESWETFLARFMVVGAIDAQILSWKPFSIIRATWPWPMTWPQNQ